MRGLWLLNILSVFSVFSPPIFLEIAWVRFLQPEARSERPKWRHVLGAANLLGVSVLFSVCVVKFFGNNCNADAGDWSRVIAWRSFARSIVLGAPFFLALAILGAKRTRILTFIFGLGILVDMMGIAYRRNVNA